MSRTEKAIKEFEKNRDQLDVLDASYLVGNMKEKEYRSKRKKLEEQFIRLKKKYADLL